MSGPYCETCKFFHAASPLGPEFGICEDPGKIIYDRNGNRVTEQPDVHVRYTCCEWTTKGGDQQHVAEDKT